MALKVKRIYTSTGKSGDGENGSLQGPFDVVVHLDNGDQYVASFFTYESVQALRRRHQTSGDYLKGAYFWSKNMVLVEDGRPETVRRIVEYLVEEGEFLEAFEKV